MPVSSVRQALVEGVVITALVPRQMFWYRASSPAKTLEVITMLYTTPSKLQAILYQAPGIFLALGSRFGEKALQI